MALDTSGTGRSHTIEPSPNGTHIHVLSFQIHVFCSLCGPVNSDDLNCPNYIFNPVSSPFPFSSVALSNHIHSVPQNMQASFKPASYATPIAITQRQALVQPTLSTWTDSAAAIGALGGHHNPHISRRDQLHTQQPASHQQHQALWTPSHPSAYSWDGGHSSIVFTPGPDEAQPVHISANPFDVAHQAYSSATLPPQRAYEHGQQQAHQAY